MSLDLDTINKKGIAIIETPVTALDAGDMQAAAFTKGNVEEADTYIIPVDTTVGPVGFQDFGTPADYPFMKDGDKVVVVKATDDLNPLVLEEGTHIGNLTGLIVAFANQKGERYTLTAVGNEFLFI